MILLLREAVTAPCKGIARRSAPAAHRCDQRPFGVSDIARIRRPCQSAARRRSPALHVGRFCANGAPINEFRSDSTTSWIGSNSLLKNSKSDPSGMEVLNCCAQQPLKKPFSANCYAFQDLWYIWSSRVCSLRYAAFGANRGNRTKGLMPQYSSGEFDVSYVSIGHSIRSP